MPPISVSSAFNSRIDDGQYVRMILNSARTACCLRFIQWEMPIQDAIRGNGQEFHHWLDGNLPHRWPSFLYTDTRNETQAVSGPSSATQHGVSSSRWNFKYFWLGLTQATGRISRGWHLGGSAGPRRIG